MPRPRRGRWRPRLRGPEDEWTADNSDDLTLIPELKIDKLNTSKRLKIPLDNLGSRHRALNSQVNDAFANQVDFDYEKTRTEDTEIDKLFKIDLASKYKNVNYIVEVLKSGDSLYIARALNKCQWLFSDDYSDIINPGYLHENIFPLISMRMKRKILKAAAKNITNPDRALQFFHCCLKEKMTNSALICLLYTSEAFKIDVLQNKKESVSELNKKDIVYIRFFVGKSFTLLKAFLDFLDLTWKISLTVRRFKNFYYSVSKEEYLDIVDKYIDTSYGFQTTKLDEKLSESIMKNHKDRVLAKPKFYVNTVNTKILVQYSTIDDAKIYAAAILPDNGKGFWSSHYYSIFKPVFEIIPEEKTYVFFKDFFAEHYPDTQFEMDYGFYEYKYYKFMTVEEKQEWALRHLKSQKQILGVGNDYRWYKFVKFELAFPEVKALVNITKKADIRNNMVKVLIKSVRNNRDLESLFIYYYKRHVNEPRYYKDVFLDKVINHHNVFKFDKPCWTAFYNVLLSMDLYNTADTTSDQNIQANDTYKTITVLYHILYEEPFPEELMKYFLEDFHVDSFNGFLEDIGYDNYQKLHDFFFDVYMKNLVEFKHQPHSGAVAARTQRYFANIKSSMAIFHEEILPQEKRKREITKKTRYISDTLSDRKLLRDLKKDKRLVVSQISDVKTGYESSTFRLNNFLKKIKIYFPEDITKVYLDMFENLINENKELRLVKAGVHGIFDLGDEKTKLDLISKYAPTTAKIDRKSVDIGQLRAQKAICQYACISRPPLPLSSMVMYMKGSCAKYFLRVFNTYLATIPLPMCLEFVYLVIDAPISIQKHAIRLAFQCFSTDDLIKVITDIWEKTKNVSMRSVIYKALFNKVVETEKQMYVDVLLKLTLSLHQNDENELFDLLISNKVAEEFLGGYIEAAWEAVGLFEDKQPNINRKKKVICCIQNKLHLLRKSFVLKIVQQHMDIMIKENKLALTYAEEDSSKLYKEKWQLIARFTMHYTRSECPVDEYVQMCQNIVNNSINKWNEIIDGEFVYQTLVWDFFNDLKEASVKHNTEYFEDGLPIFEDFLSIFKSSLPFQDTYKLTWELELAIMTRKIVKENKNTIENDDIYDVIIETMTEFSKELSKLVSMSANNERFFMSYSSNICEIIIKHVKSVLHVIYYYDRACNESEYLDEVLITLASGLVKNELPETYMLAVQLLPTNSGEEDEENFQLVFNKLQKYPNPEVQFSLYSKFQKLCIKNKT